MPYLMEQGYSKADLGLSLSGVSIAYGLSKFIMCSVSERSNARVFMALGFSCAALIMIIMGTMQIATRCVTIMFVFILMNALFQVMGYTQPGRVMWDSCSLSDVANKAISGSEITNRFLQVNNINAVTGAKDIRLHLGVPTTGLVTEMNTGLQHLTHGYVRHCYFLIRGWTSTHPKR